MPRPSLLITSFAYSEGVPIERRMMHGGIVAVTSVVPNRRSIRAAGTAEASLALGASGTSVVTDEPDSSSTS